MLKNTQHFRQIKMMKVSTVISFDIGSVNMAWCSTHVHHIHGKKDIVIKEWENIDIKMETVELSSSYLVSALKMCFKDIPDNKNTWIMIERQLPQNYACSCLGFTVFTYFLSRYDNVHVSSVSPQSKKLNSRGQKRKHESVETVKDLLDTEMSKTWLEKLKRHKKKDDLADAYMQIVGNIGKVKWYNLHEVIEID